MLAAARTVVAFGLILQVAGFGKLLLIADYFGAGPLLDAYYLGLVIPTFLNGVSVGILQSAFVPAYVGARARGDRANANMLASAMLSWTAVTMGVVASLLAVLRGAVVPLLSQHIGPDTQHALRSAFVLLVWSAPLNALADAGALLLNAEGRFAAAAAAPLLNALAGVLVLLVWRGGVVDALVWSLLAGLAVQAMVVVVAIRAAGIRLRLRFSLPPALPRLLGSVALPVLASMVLANLVPAFIQMMSARAGTGAISAMGYAWRLHNSLVQAVVLSISGVLLPHFARLIAEVRTAELRATLERVLVATLLFAAATIVLVAAAGPLLVQVLLQRGHFTATDTQLVSRVWLALTVGLLGTTWGIFIARLFQAQQRVWVIFALGCISVAANVVFAFALLPIYGVVGVALANSLAYTLTMSLFHRRANREVGPLLGRTAYAFIARAALANVVAYALALGWENLLGGSNPLAVLVGQFFVVGAANLLVARTAPLNVGPMALLKR